MALTDRPRALAVILSQTRGLSLTWESMEVVGLRHYEVDFAFCGAHSSGVTSKFKYLWDMPEPRDWIGTLRESLPAPIFEFFFGDLLPGHESTARHELWISGFIQMYFRNLALQNISKLALREMYDWVFIIRADYMFEAEIPVPMEFPEFSALAMDGDSYGGINDRFFGFSTSVSAQVERAFDLGSLESLTGGFTLVEFLSGRTSANPEMLVLFLLEREGLLASTGLIPQKGFCVRQLDESSRWSLGHWSSKRNLFVKYPTELALVKINGFLNISTSTARPILNGTQIVPSSFRANFIRVLGTQPRLLMAPFLCLLGEFELSRRVFFESRRTQTSVWKEFIHDVGVLGKDIVSVLSRLKSFRIER